MAYCGDGVVSVWVREDDHVAFIDFAAIGVECVCVFARCVRDGFDAAMARGAVDVNVEYAHENANTDCGFAKGFEVFYFVNGSDFAITCSDDSATLRGDASFRVAEELDNERDCEKNDNCSPPDTEEQASGEEEDANCDCSKPFVTAVDTELQGKSPKNKKESSVNKVL